MLIKNIEVTNSLRNAKQQIFAIARQLNASFQPFALVYVFIANIATLFPNCSILFKGSDPFPSIVSQIFRIFLLTNLTGIFGINEQIVAAIVIVYCLLVVVLTVAHLVFTQVFTFCTKLLCLLFKLGQFLLVPLADYGAHLSTHFSSPNISLGLLVLSGIVIVLLVMSFLALAIYLKFNIRVTRKKNQFWNLDNDLHLYAMIYLIFKTYMISLNGVTVSICFLSLVEWNFLRQIPGGCISHSPRVIEFSTYNYIAAADLGVLLSLITDNQFFGLNIWVFALISLVMYCIVQIYLSGKGKLYIPICSSSPEQFYNFYYQFRQQFKNEDMSSTQKKNYSSAYQLHHIHCAKDQCGLPSGNAEDQEAVEATITAMITCHKIENIDFRLLFQLWNLQLGRKCEVDYICQKRLSLNQDFILYCIENLTRDSEVTIRTSESNKGAVSKVFYDLIFEISSDYSLFYEELARTHPKIDAVVRLGIGIRKKVDKLKEAYSELLRSRLINFKMIELYLQFFTSFVKEDVLDKDSVARLMKVQQHMHFEDIAENFLPTFTVYPDTGYIQNANSEAQKFLKSTRFELKYRNVSDVLLPSVSVEQLKMLLAKELDEYDDDQVYSFFKKSDKQYGCGTLKVSERYVKQKKLLVLQISRQPFSDLKCMMLVNQQFQILLISKENAKVKTAHYRANPLTLAWRDLFSKYIKESKDKLLKTKMAKLNTDYKGCILIVKKLNSLEENTHIFMAQIIVSNQNVKDRKESILQNRRSFQNARMQGHFQFQYSEEQHEGKAIIYAYKKEFLPKNNFLQTSRINRLEGSQQSGQENGTNAGRLLGKDIKTYRLYDGQLYNVDLQDREAYNDIFKEHLSESKKKEVNDQTSLEFYIFLGVILLGIALIAFSIALIIQFQSDSQSIQSDYIQHQNIQSFNIDFQRLLTLLRDQTSGLFSNYPQVVFKNEVQESYSRIQQLKNSTLFDSSEYSINFQSLIMTGTLSELVDVILAHVTQIIDSGDLSIVQDIHQTCIEQMNGMLLTAQNEVGNSISNQISGLTMLKDALLYSSICLVLLIYFLMIMYCVKSNFKSKDKLSDLMYISDSEAKLLQQNAQKMKYAVEMARKNFDIDTQSLLNNSTDFKKRRNPKEAILSRQIVYTIGGITVVGFLLHIICLFVFSYVFSNQISNFQTIINQGEYVTSVFPASCELTNDIDHLGQLNPVKLNKIRESLSQIEHNMGNLLFSGELSSFINTLYFQDSCQQQLQMFNYPSTNCSNTCPTFTITNPFQIGLALYFNRQNYYISNNLTQNFAHTGVFSNQFARIFTNLTVMIQKEGTNKLQQTFLIVSVLNGIIIIIDCSYILAFVIIYHYFRNQFQKIKEILFFFSTKLKAKNKAADSEDEEDNEQISEEQSEEAALVKDQKTINKSRRTTIEKKIELGD